MSNELLQQIKDEVSDIKGTVSTIEMAIKGDDARGVKGIVHAINEHGKRIDVLEKHAQENKNLKLQAKGAFLGAGFMGGAWGIPLLKALLLKIATFFS